MTTLLKGHLGCVALKHVLAIHLAPDEDGQMERIVAVTAGGPVLLEDGYMVMEKLESFQKQFESYLETRG